MADNIRFYRERSGLLQSDLGKQLGVTAQAVSKWERGKSEPDRNSIVTMCALFGVTADELLGASSSRRSLQLFASPALTDDEQALLDLFRTLNAAGQDVLMTTAQSLAGNPSLRKHP